MPPRLSALIWEMQAQQTTLTGNTVLVTNLPILQTSLHLSNATVVRGQCLSLAIRAQVVSTPVTWHFACLGT